MASRLGNVDVGLKDETPEVSNRLHHAHLLLQRRLGGRLWDREVSALIAWGGGVCFEI